MLNPARTALRPPMVSGLPVACAPKLISRNVADARNSQPKGSDSLPSTHAPVRASSLNVTCVSRRYAVGIRSSRSSWIRLSRSLVPAKTWRSLTSGSTRPLSARRLLPQDGPFGSLSGQAIFTHT